MVKNPVKSLKRAEKNQTTMSMDTAYRIGMILHSLIITFNALLLDKSHITWNQIHIGEILWVY